MDPESHNPLNKATRIIISLQSLMRICGDAIMIYFFLAFEAVVLANFAAVSKSSIAVCNDDVNCSSWLISCGGFHNVLRMHPIDSMTGVPHLLVHCILQALTLLLQCREGFLRAGTKVRIIDHKHLAPP